MTKRKTNAVWALDREVQEEKEKRMGEEPALRRTFVIAGQNELYGTYPVQGNKNAALPLIAAALLTRGRVIFRKMPRILDVENLLRLVQAVGVQVTWQEERLIVDSSRLEPGVLPENLVKRLRGAILLLGPLAPAWGDVSLAIPGGCPLGRRSFDVHWSVFRAAGFNVKETFASIRLQKTEAVDFPEVYLEEASVTATENALIAYAQLGGGLIQNPAREPHIFSLIDFLRAAGCEIELHPLWFRIRRGVRPTGEEIQFSIPGDYIDAGTAAIATAVTGGEIHLQNVTRQELMGIQKPLERFGVVFEFSRDDCIKVRSNTLRNPPDVTAGPWPLFPTDLTSLAIVLATQGQGLCLVHDWMYESRMFFVDKLVRMGARITMCDPHRVLVEGPSKLRGTRLESPDIRAGMALVIAGLCARGTTTIEHGEVILRGYEDVLPRWTALGARIQELK